MSRPRALPSHLHHLPVRDAALMGGPGLGPETTAASAAASLIDLAAGLVLLRAGRRNRSITLEADRKHLMTDVWTSACVIVGVAAVAISGWERLDPIIALLVAINIGVTGGERSRGGGAR